MRTDTIINGLCACACLLLALVFAAAGLILAGVLLPLADRFVCLANWVQGKGFINDVFRVNVTFFKKQTP